MALFKEENVEGDLCARRGPPCVCDVHCRDRPALDQQPDLHFIWKEDEVSPWTSVRGTPDWRMGLPKGRPLAFLWQL